MRPTYVLRLAVFDGQGALDARRHLRVEESALSLDTPTGLPIALDRQARALLPTQHIPQDLLDHLSARLQVSSGGRLSLNPTASSFQPAKEAADRVVPLFAPLRPLNFRFGPVSIEWEDMPHDHGVAGPQSRQARAEGKIDVGFGVIQLFRDVEPAKEPCTILGILAIPPVMSIAEFLVFVQPAADSISQIRMIKDALPNRCMALLKFRNAEDAELFQEEYDGKPFWAMLDDEICHIVRIRSVEVTASTTPPFTFPSQDAQPIPGPSGTIELPTCPVCLERMDSSVTGLTTILCGHQFHCNCLSKWSGGNGKCPVCRYSQQRSIKPAEEPTMASRCDVCDVGTAGESLWMCLLCGHVGCGRYQGGHAAAHYEATTHLYAIELDSQRVWDYAADEYVHRLIQSKTDGKLVELPSRYPEPDETLPGVPSGGPNRAARQAQEKAEAVGLEYQHLLSSQLASQRAYYSDMVTHLKDEMASLELKAKEEAAKLEIRAKRADKAIELTRVLQKELASEREMTKGLLSNLQQLREEHRRAREETAGVRAEVGDLQEQLRDLMFALSARDQMADSELAGGSISVPAQDTGTASPSPRRHRGKR